MGLDEKILGKRHKQKQSSFLKFRILSIIVILLLCGWSYYYHIGSKRVFNNVRITQLEAKDGRFLILTDHGAFKNEDSWLHLKTRSADLQGSASPGDIVSLEVYGIRNGFLSSFQNVVKINKTGERE